MPSSAGRVPAAARLSRSRSTVGYLPRVGAAPAPGGREPLSPDTGAASSGDALRLTPLTGLSAAEVADAVDRGLTNDAGRQSSRPLKDIIRANVLTPFNALLGSLALIVLCTGLFADALFGLVIVWNSLVGIVQEVRAKRTLDRLAVLNAPHARAVRDAATLDIAVEEVVLGDILQLRTGDQIVADGVLRAADGLEVDESLLTGESDAVAKEAGEEVLSGSIVVAGSGTSQVHRVGADSFASRLTAEARAFRLTKSELVAGINRILRYVAVAIVVIAPILFWSQTRSTTSWRDAVRGTVAGLVGMVPEGLVLLATITFFAAAVTLARRRVLVQELPAVEGLARVDVLCLDKTGTLTAGDISFAAAEPLGEAGGARPGARRRGCRRKRQRHHAGAAPGLPGLTRVGQAGAGPLLLGPKVERGGLRRPRFVGPRRAGDGAAGIAARGPGHQGGPARRGERQPDAAPCPHRSAAHR